MVSGSVALSKSENAEHSFLAASNNLSPEDSSSIRAAIILTPLVISGRLVAIVVMAAPTAVWSTSSAGPEVRVTTWAVAAFIAAICEPTFCLWVSIVCSIHFNEAGSVPSSGSWAFEDNSVSAMWITSWPAVMVDSKARCGSDRTDVTFVCCTWFQRFTNCFTTMVNGSIYDREKSKNRRRSIFVALASLEKFWINS